MTVQFTVPPILEVSHLKNYLGGRYIQNDLSMTVQQGEIVTIIGGSGTGKTTLLRSILMLLKPVSGVIKVFGIDITQCTEREATLVQHRWGVLFQNGALFSSLTVFENVLFPLKIAGYRERQLDMKIAQLKIALVGLDADVLWKYPAELSGGMQKRVAMARAIVLDPEIVFLDEPTSGLDPTSAAEMDDLILHLRKHLGLTFVMITHDLDTLLRIPDRILFLGEGKILASAPFSELMNNKHPVIQAYFNNVRAKDRLRGGEEGWHGY